MSLVEKPKGEPFDNGPKKPDGQYYSYAVLPESERAKGFVRPVRKSYRHVGVRPQYPIRDLTEEEIERYASYEYVAYEAYPENPTSALGRFWTTEQLHSGCGQVTTMADAIAETFARDPQYYGAGFCCTCGRHFPNEQFVWDGTNEKVGS